ncbi:hypothetical protein [Falsiroseomonas sp. HW251]|uniref:hypothetical protein n=1 Tax=Falsiroseomonas sp. HW251 TaxID=3390998 RepID=UPI003D323F51
MKPLRILALLTPAMLPLASTPASPQANLRTEFSRASETRISTSHGALTLRAQTDPQTGSMTGSATYGPEERDCGGPLTGLVEVYAVRFSAGQCSGKGEIAVNGIVGSVTTPLGTEAVRFWPGR